MCPSGAMTMYQPVHLSATHIADEQWYGSSNGPFGKLLGGIGKDVGVAVGVLVGPDTNGDGNGVSVTNGDVGGVGVMGGDTNGVSVGVIVIVGVGVTVGIQLVKRKTSTRSFFITFSLEPLGWRTKSCSVLQLFEVWLVNCP